MAALLSLVIFLFHFPIVIFCSTISVNDQVHNDGQRGNPGSKFFLTKKFTDYANEIVIGVLDRVGPRVQLSDVTFKAGDNYLAFSDLKVAHFKSPDVVTTDFQKPNKLILHFNHTDVTVNGKFDTKYNGLKANGNFNGSAIDTDVSLTILVGHDVSGRLHVSSEECHAKIKKFDLHVYDAGMFDQIFYAFKIFLVGFIRVNVEEKVCRELKFLVNGHLDGKLKDIPTKIFLSSFFPFKNDLESNNVLKSLAETFQRLVLDYSLLTDPKVTDDTVKLSSKSEISFEGVGNTPFFPAPMDDHCEDSMACLSISDYVLNSFLWHAYNRDSLNFQIENLKSDRLKELFSSICRKHGESDCMIDEILDHAEKIFPNSEYNLSVRAIESPAVIIEIDKATIFTRNYANLTAHTKDHSNSVLESEFTAIARFAPYLKINTSVYANFSIEKFRLKLLSSSDLLNFTEIITDKFGHLIKLIIEENVNKFLQHGIRPPRLKEISFVNSNFELLNRRLKIDTDVNVSLSDLQQIVDNAMKKD